MISEILGNVGEMRGQPLSDLGRVDAQPLLSRLERCLLVERVTCFLADQFYIMTFLGMQRTYVRSKSLLPTHWLFRVVGDLDELYNIAVA